MAPTVSVVNTTSVVKADGGTTGSVGMIVVVSVVVTAEIISVTDKVAVAGIVEIVVVVVWNVDCGMLRQDLDFVTSAFPADIQFSSNEQNKQLTRPPTRQHPAYQLFEKETHSLCSLRFALSQNGLRLKRDLIPAHPLRRINQRSISPTVKLKNEKEWTSPPSTTSYINLDNY
jgi:hypothetical protein